MMIVGDQLEVSQQHLQHHGCHAKILHFDLNDNLNLNDLQRFPVYSCLKTWQNSTKSR